ncbi:hypothetical protein Q0Z83_015000 [Actinoplanes sichuanensis]|uniref:Carboxypeptidase regulatory-like domain-containing protein n=1 Tax=Actinoplanes sichuanensis TaxID=512349 RepID=A0ABW4A807_9ACTN|nr:carboxypeptidase-like regulatory domain-containing protein [Actinoplanes sichuanensis]BEL03309.1 hypothetical protein Q0Z83_015000 [Actinoplanes sichuanensis]
MLINTHGKHPARTAAAGILAAAVLTLSAPSAAHADPATGSLSGTLTTADGAPMADVGVSVHTLAGPAAGAPARTDSAGHYRVADLPPGTYRVQFWVERNTSSSWHQWAHQATWPAQASRFTVTAGADLVVDETRFRTGSLSLTLQDAAGEPIDAFCADATGDNFVETGCTESGTLLLADLPADDYLIAAWTADATAFDLTTTAADQVNHFTLTAF